MHPFFCPCHASMDSPIRPFHLHQQVSKLQILTNSIAYRIFQIYYSNPFFLLYRTCLLIDVIESDLNTSKHVQTRNPVLSKLVRPVSEQKEKDKEKEELPMKKKNSKPLGFGVSWAPGKKMRGKPFTGIYGKNPSPTVFPFFFVECIFPLQIGIECTYHIYIYIYIYISQMGRCNPFSDTPIWGKTRLAR